MHSKRKTYTVEEAISLMERYCIYRERSYREVEERMQRLAFIPELRQRILLHLIEGDFLNEERYARAYARGKFYINHWGKNKIRNALRMNGVSKKNIELGIEEIDSDDYHKTLVNLLENKWRSLSHKPIQERRGRVLRYLQQKGFESGMIYEMLQGKS
jgi:regulatory protein